MTVEEMLTPQSSVEELLYDVPSQMTPEQLKHQNPNVRSWFSKEKAHQRNDDLRWRQSVDRHSREDHERIVKTLSEPPSAEALEFYQRLLK